MLGAGRQGRYFTGRCPTLSFVTALETFEVCDVTFGVSTVSPPSMTVPVETPILSSTSLDSSVRKPGTTTTSRARWMVALAVARNDMFTVTGVALPSISLMRSTDIMNFAVDRSFEMTVSVVSAMPIPARMICCSHRSDFWRAIAPALPSSWGTGVVANERHSAKTLVSTHPSTEVKSAKNCSPVAEDLLTAATPGPAPARA